jgi:hypothetical protein
MSTCIPRVFPELSKVPELRVVDNHYLVVDYLHQHASECQVPSIFSHLPLMGNIINTIKMARASDHRSFAMTRTKCTRRRRD